MDSERCAEMMAASKLPEVLFRSSEFPRGRRHSPLLWVAYGHQSTSAPSSKQANVSANSSKVSYCRQRGYYCLTESASWVKPSSRVAWTATGVVIPGMATGSLMFVCPHGPVPNFNTSAHAFTAFDIRPPTLGMSAPSVHAEPPPEVVRDPEGLQYETGPQLGKGGFAICHRAKLLGHEHLGSSTVALKIVRSKMEPPKLAQKVRRLRLCSSYFY